MQLRRRRGTRQARGVMTWYLRLGCAAFGRCGHARLGYAMLEAIASFGECDQSDKCAQVTVVTAAPRNQCARQYQRQGFSSIREQGTSGTAEVARSRTSSILTGSTWPT